MWRDERQLGSLGLDTLKILEHRVRRALVPVVMHALHRRQHFDVFAQLGRQDVPAIAHVANQVERFVLREHKDTARSRVDAVGEGKIDNAIDPAKRDRRLGRLVGERVEALPRAPRQQNCEDIFHFSISL